MLMQVLSTLEFCQMCDEQKKRNVLKETTRSLTIIYNYEVRCREKSYAYDRLYELTRK